MTQTATKIPITFWLIPEDASEKEDFGAHIHVYLSKGAVEPAGTVLARPGFFKIINHTHHLINYAPGMPMGTCLYNGFCISRSVTITAIARGLNPIMACL